MYFDSHCHLDPSAFEDDAGIDAAVARAHEAGVEGMVTVGAGYGAECADNAVHVANRHPHDWATVGLQPHDASAWSSDVVSRLRTLARDPKVVAIGEMGLDFYYDNSPRDLQRKCLREQIALALELGLPIVVHDRASGGETLRILMEEEAFAGTGVLYHCYSGDREHMQRIVDAGGVISIPGIVTFKKADEMRAVAREAPATHYLIETDTPFLSPVPYRGKRNEPARVVHVAAAVAEARGESVQAVATETTANTRRFFNI